MNSAVHGIPMTVPDEDEIDHSEELIIKELQSLLDEIKQLNSKEQTYATQFQDPLDPPKQFEDIEEETPEERERRWGGRHNYRKKKTGELIDNLKKNIDILQRGTEKRDVGSYLGPVDEKDVITPLLDEEFRKTIAASNKLLSQINGYFCWVSTNEHWENMIAGQMDGLSTDIEDVSSLLRSNKFLEENFINELKIYTIDTDLDDRPKMYLFIKSVLLQSILSVYGGINALIMYIMDANGIEEVNEMFGQHLNADTYGEGGMEFVKNSSVLSGFDYPMSQKESKEINDLLQNLIWSMGKYAKTLESLPIGEGKYSPTLSDVNSHVVTNNYRPRETYKNLGMWPLEREKDYHSLVELDLNNWLGLEQHSQNLNYKAELHRINYRDLIDFLQSLGYVHKKVTSYGGFRRVKPVLSMFDWGERACKFRSTGTIYFHNPHCPISGTEIRIAVKSISGPRVASLEIHVGFEFFKNQDSLGEQKQFGNDEDLMLLRESAEKFIQRLMKDFDAYQCINGLLKNSKFDATIQQLNPKGRTFDNMILSDSKKQLLEENIFAILSNSERLIERGVETNRGIMLAGPPGVGKSLTIDAVISKANCTVIFTNYLMLMTDMEGIFTLARRYAPTILILEDIDALGITGQRGESGSGAGLSTLLNCMDGINSNNGVISIATSNHPEHMDWALIARPGRFDVRIDYPYPGHDILKSIMELKLSPYSCQKNLNLDELVSMMPLGFTGSHIHDIVNQANYICLNNSKDDAIKVKITQKALESATIRTLYNFKKFLAERPQIKLQNPPSVSEVLSDKKDEEYYQ